MTKITRRDFLRAVGMAGVGSVAPNLLTLGPLNDQVWGQAIAHWDGSQLGRVLIDHHSVYKEPDWRTEVLAQYRFHDVVNVTGVVPGYGLYPANANYLQVDGGYMYSSWVQPVANNASNPIQAIGEGGAWGELTVPVAYSKSSPDDAANDRERLFYSQVMRITGVSGDYYQVSEVYGAVYYIKANLIRIIAPEEVAPISPNADPGAKRIEVSIKEQRLWAYEADQVVFETLIASGMPGSPTPMQTFNIRDKRHGQRMTGGKTGGGYNLAGIPFINYITKSWVALHGCYWHNDYGRRHSNGCINLYPGDAKWLFRWTTPYADYYAFNTRPDQPGQLPGTKVKIRW
jgi:lipoprotein-anchoring transpeptidase ErfK/SrfK